MSPGPEKPLRSDGAPDPLNDPQYIHLKRSHIYLALIPLAFGAGITCGYLLWGRLTSALAESQSFSNAGVRFEIDSVNDLARGPVGAPISIVEFGDHNSQRWHPEVYKELLAAYPEQNLFTTVDFPIVGGGAIGFGATLAANCSEEQGTFWEYHDALFSGAYPLDQAGFEGTARELGLDSQAPLECIDSGRFARVIQADLEYGANIGVNGTPTFFINGNPIISARPLLRFVEVVNGELGQ